MKKFLALLVCMTMLLSLVPVVQAENTVYLTDNFDTDPLGDFNPIYYRGNYPTSNPQGSTTDIVGNGTSWANPNNDVFYTIISDGAYQGQALQLSKTTTPDSKYYLVTEDIPAPTDENPVYVNFKLKIVDDGFDGVDPATRATVTITGGGANVMFIKENNGPKLWPWRDTYQDPNGKIATRIPYELGQWYDVAIKFTSEYVYSTVKDTKGNAAYGRIERTKQTGVKIESDTTHASTIVVDEMYMIQGSDAMNFISSNSGALSVSKNVVYNVDFNGEDFTSRNPAALNDFANYMHNVAGVVRGGSIAENGTGTSGNLSWYGANAPHTVEDDCKGGKAPQFTLTPGKYSAINFASADFDANTKAYNSFKIKIVDDKRAITANGLGAQFFAIGFGTASSGSAGGYDLMIRNGAFEAWNYWGRGDVCNYVLDTWYTVVLEFVEIDGLKQANLRIYDDANNCVYNRDAVPTVTPTSGSAPTAAQLALRTYSNVSGTGADAVTLEEGPVVALDDLKLLTTPASTDADTFIRQEILGENAYSTSIPSVRAEFSQIVGEDSVAKFVTSDGEVPALIHFAGVSPIVEITPAHPLLDGKTYTLDLSGVKSLSGDSVNATSLKQFSFTTLPYSVGSMTVGKHIIANGILKLPVTFANADYREVNTKLIVALYNGDSLAWAGIKDVKAATPGLNTFFFENVPAEEGLTLKVFAFDNFMSLRALYK